MAKAENKLVIIDGNALIHRSYHALPPLRTKDGTVVNAVYGFASIVLKILQDLKPTHIVASFDMPGKTFRHDTFDGYKATRKKADKDLYDQIPLVHQLVEAFDIPIFELPGYEADDVIGTIAAQVGDKAHSIIVTGDMDTLQLVDESTSVFTMRKGINDTVTYDPAAVFERYGLKPDQIVDLKSLQGDSSDNIPGVPGIGQKGATTLLQSFKTLEGVLKAAQDASSDIKPAARKKLLEGKESAVMSQDLATIRTDVPINFSLRDAALHTTDWQKVADSFSRFEFTSLLRRLPKEAQRSLGDRMPAAGKKRKKKAVISSLSNKKEIDDLLRKAHDQKSVGLSLLPESNDRINAPIAAAIVCLNGDGFIIPFSNMDETQKTSLIDLLQTDTVIGHDLKQLFVLLGDGAPKGCKLFDVMVASYLLNPGSRSHDVEGIALKRLGAHLGDGQREGLFGADYEHAAKELCAMTSLYETLKQELDDAGVLDLFETIEMPLIPVLAGMEKKGIKVDEKVLQKLSKSVTKRIEELTEQIHKEAGEHFNISSSVQLRDILYDKLALPTQGIKKGKTGLSTAASELEKLRASHPIIQLIEEYRELTKLQSTYTDALPKLINKKTGRIHSSFNQTVAATGRLSSSDPNLQNIPVRTELGRQIRDAFIAEKGHVLLALDYSQIELRIAAHIAKDAKMIEAFKQGQDIHSATAAAINGISLDKVTGDQRRAAKAINFGILYGMGAFGMAARTGLPQWQAREFIDKYFAAFFSVRRYLDETIELGKGQGYVETLFGRRRYIPELRAGSANIRAAGERQAINHPIQGTAADVMKKAMIDVAAFLKDDPDCQMLLQVHDELVFEVKEKKAAEYTQKIKDIMEDVIALDVPVEVSAGTGKNWGTVK